MLQELYRNILGDLRSGRRPLVSLTPQQLEEVEREWESVLSSSSPSDPPLKDKLLPILCVLEHTKTLVNNFDSLFWRTLSCKDIDSETIVLVLGALGRQVIDRCQKDAVPVPHQLLGAIRGLLEHSDPEVLEWCLRTVESAGPLSVYLKKEILVAKPGVFGGLFNRHKRAARQIVQLLEKRWKLYER